MCSSDLYGFRYAAIRRPIQNAQTHDYVRVSTFVAPFHIMIPPNNVYNVYQMTVPVDDTHNIIYIVAWSDTGPGVELEAWRRFTGTQIGIDLDKTYRKVNNFSNNYGQDRQLMRLGNFTGIRGFPNQDIAMQETMGAIADRSGERLGASDVAIVEFRRLMIKAAREFMEGKRPPGIGVKASDYPVYGSWERIVPKGTDWRDFEPYPLKQAAE